MIKFLVGAVVVLLSVTFAVSLVTRLFEIAAMLLLGVAIGVVLDRWLVRR